MSAPAWIGNPGRQVFGAGVAALGMVGLAWRDFVLGQPVARDLPARTALACAAAAFTIAAGVALQWRRSAAPAAAALFAYYALVVVILMNGPVIIAHYSEYVSYSGAAEEVAIATAALIVYATTARTDAARTAGIARQAQGAFAVCVVLFGGAHFVYMNLTAPLVPRWLPFGQPFWAYATGVAQIAAGLAILTGIRAALAAALLTIMYASFTPLIHLPMLLAHPSDRMVWTENAINLALTGAAWVVAQSLATGARRSSAARACRVRDDPS